MRGVVEAKGFWFSFRREKCQIPVLVTPCVQAYFGIYFLFLSKPGEGDDDASDGCGRLLVCIEGEVKRLQGALERYGADEDVPMEKLGLLLGAYIATAL